MAQHFLRKEQATLHDMDEIIRFVEEHTRKLDVDASTIQYIVLATLEAVTNILTHGYEEETGFVEIEIKREGKSLVICFRDHAVSFDPTQIPTPDIALPLGQRPMGGLGVHLIRIFLDELIHKVPSHGGNELICIKKDVFL